MEKPYNGLATIDDHLTGMKITIPARKNWFIVVFLGFWLCGWIAGETFALKTVITSLSGGAPELFIIVWLCGWTIGGLFAFRTFWWLLMGKEVISIDQGALTIDKRGALFYKAKTYDLHEAKNFRAQEEYVPVGPFGNRGMTNVFNMKNNGTIKFDYGLQTVKFAGSIDEAEANFILEKLRSKRMIN